MDLKNDRELEETRRKLGILENRLAESRNEVPRNPTSHDLSQRCLKRMSNQMKEEIVRPLALLGHGAIPLDLEATYMDARIRARL